MDNYLQDYKSLYLSTSREQIEKISADISSLLLDFSNKDALDEAYVASHSLASKSLLMNFPQVGFIMRFTESNLKSIKNGENKPSEELFNALLSACFEVKKSFDEIEKNGTEPDLSSITGTLENLGK